ncbi:U6 snRNA-associated Sm-like protein LSm2 [Podila epigama]|nr:U6 snRNA-associated Sm-like protein LSm2 [Podila epigama]
MGTNKLFSSGTSVAILPRGTFKKLNAFFFNGETTVLFTPGLFYSFFKTLVGQPVTVELKNDLAITGVLVSVDQFLNIKLDNIKVVDEERYPHMLAVKNCFIRGSVVRYVQLPAPSVDTALLQDAARRERQQPAAGGRK